MAHLRTVSASGQSIGAPGLIKPFKKDRTREEVIDFSEGKTRHPLTRWMALALVVMLAAGLWLFGWPWYVNRGVEKIEQQAMTFYLSGDFDAAENLCRSVHKEMPGSPISNLILGNINLIRGDRDVAMRFFQTAVDSNQGSKETKAEALMGLARLSSMVHQPQDALQLYQRAAAVDPQSVRALTSQAIILESQNRDTEALSLYRRVLDRFPNDRGVQLAAQEITERLSWQQDQAKQSRIDQLVNDLLERDRKTITSLDDENRWTSKPLSVWLMDFEEAGFGLQEGQGRTVHILIRDLLTKSPRVKMVEREILDKLLNELHLGSSQLAERQTALSIGRLMAARIILPGQIQYGDGGALISIRAIDCETGLISASVVDTYNSSQTSLEIAQDMAVKITKELMAKFPLRSRVSEVNGTEIVLDIGQNLGLQNGQYFRGVDNDVIVQITSVDSDHSTAKVIRGEDAITPGLMLEEKTPDTVDLVN